jgi:DNA-binding IclR family transcriptional regulator
MARKPNQERLQEIYQAIEENPGQRSGFIAWLLGLNRSDVTRALPGMEEHEYFLSEDERGGLWPFKRKKTL